jgi:hypothetical protein
MMTWYGLWVVGLPYIGLALFATYYIRNNHFSAWQALGEPSLLNNSIRNSYRLFRYFVLGHGYQKLSDPFLNKLATTLKALFAIFCLLFFATLISMSRVS